MAFTVAEQLVGFLSGNAELSVVLRIKRDLCIGGKGIVMVLKSYVVWLIAGVL